MSHTDSDEREACRELAPAAVQVVNGLALAQYPSPGLTLK